MNSLKRLFIAGKPLNSSYKKAVLWSVALHLLIAAAAVGMRFNRPKKVHYAPVNVVNMVQKKAPKRPAPQEKPPQKSIAPKKQEEKKKPTPEAKKNIPPKIKHPPPTEEIKVNPNQNSGLTVAERIEKFREKHANQLPETAEQTQPSEEEEKHQDLSERLKAIRNKVGETAEKPREDIEKTSSSPAVQSTGAKSLLEEVRLKAYTDRLWKQINSHWTVPSSLKNTGLKVLIEAKIDPGGKVSKAWVEEASGSKAFDDAALRTIWKSSPFPPPPDEIIEQGMGFMFSSDQ